MQDLQQDKIYRSSREGDIEVRWMIVTHAQRALSKLVKDHGDAVLTTPLGMALQDRASREGTATGIDAIDGKSHMIKGKDGRFVGAWTPTTGRKG